MNEEKIQFKRQTERALKKSILERKKLKSDEIKTIHVLLSILLDNSNMVSTTFKHFQISYDIVLDEYLELYEDVLAELDSPMDEDDDDDIFERKEEVKNPSGSGKSSNELTRMKGKGQNFNLGCNF